MANRIKGITVEIGGDTTGLEKALKNVNGNIRNTQTQLKDVNRLLKLDPTNTNLVAQKQKLLKEAIHETKRKLDTLKEAQKQAKQQFENGQLGKDKNDALQREIVETENELRRLQKEADMSSTKMVKLLVTDALTAFGLEAKDSGHFADVLDSASSNANTNVSMMGETFNYCAPIAGAFGFTAEDTAEAIGLMANAGIKSTRAAQTIINYGGFTINVYGEQGQDVSELAEVLENRITEKMKRRAFVFG